MKKKRWVRQISLTITVLMLLTQLNGLVFAQDKKKSFMDIKGHWAEKAIGEWLDNGYIQGYNDDSFQPGKQVTRAEFLAFFNRAFIPDAPVDGPAKSFTDVDETNWFYNDVMTGTRLGAITGYYDNSFRPDGVLTRQDASVMISRFLGLDVLTDETALHTYKDYTQVAAYAQNSVAALTELGIARGNPKGQFEPVHSITRAESIVMLDNAYQLIHGQAGIMGKIYHDGTPLAGAVVTFTRTNEYKPLAHTTTDDQGSFTAELKSGSYNLTISSNGQVAGRSKIVVREHFKSYIKLASESGQLVAGTLQDSLGSPLKTADLVFGPAPAFYTSTGDQGQFVIRLPRSSKYDILYPSESGLVSLGSISTTSDGSPLNLGILKFNAAKPAVVFPPAGSPSSGGGGSGNFSPIAAPVKPSLALIGDNGVLELKVDKTDPSNTYKLTQKQNGTVTQEVYKLNVTESVQIARPEISGLYSYTVTATGETGLSAESNAVNYMVTASGSGEVGTDSDMDGLDDELELRLGTDPHHADTDRDGLPDGYEYYITSSSPLLADTDENGIPDADEDLDQDGLTAVEEYRLGTDPALADSDKDGLNDGAEINKYKTDPLAWDTDGDTLIDGDEIILGLNPLLKDSDGNGVPDNEEQVEQSVSTENMDGSLLTHNEAVPSLQVKTTGNVNRTVLLQEYQGTGFGDSRAIVGKPVRITGADFDEAALSFSLGQDSGISRSSAAGPDGNTLLISRYTEDGRTVYYETDYDPTAGSLSATIDTAGTYFVMNVSDLFSELGLSLPEALDESRDTPAVSPTFRSFRNPPSFTAEQLHSMDNRSTPERTVVSATYETTEESATVTEDIYMGLPLRSAFSLKTTSLAGTAGQADIVFIIDTTGSMGDEILNVRNNVSAFVDVLKARGIAPYLGLVEYKDIEDDGINTTVVHKNGTRNWFSDIEHYKTTINALDADGGGDNPESAVDALETARLLDMRASAEKFFILITDAEYKAGNRYGITSMAEEIELLKGQKINASVVTSTWVKNLYSNLYTETGGIYANINGDFYQELLAIADKIGEVVDEGVWIYLDGAIPIATKVDVLPEDADEMVDTDTDGIPDIKELASVVPVEKFDLDGIIRTLTKGSITDTDYGVIKVYPWFSNPGKEDSDEDGYMDSEDLLPKVTFRTPTILLHGRVDNVFDCFGVETNMYDADNRTSLNNHYGSSMSLASGAGKSFDYTSYVAHEIRGIFKSTEDEKRPQNLGYELERNGYLSNKNLFAFSYPNEDMVYLNAGRLDGYIDNLAAHMAAGTEAGYFYATKGQLEKGQIDVNLIGHSMGGLVSRYYIENMNGVNNLSRLITIDTPHFGSGLAEISEYSPLFKPCDVDLDPTGKIYGGEGFDNEEKWYYNAKANYAVTHQSARLQTENAPNHKYNFIGGYDDFAPQFLPAALKDRTLTFTVIPDNRSFEAFRNSIAEGFYDSFGYRDSIDFTFTQIGGDNVVNNQSQLGIRFDSDGNLTGYVPSQRSAMSIDTFWGHNPYANFHAQNQHRAETIEQVITYLQ
ncbi:S-layer homology domain-containing protein [Paenibacillus tritici]|uniref:S-layer homology domain-containing protein n=1 Tax=Paenibacillus tritici TaxID=1873425 RepID=A0ABX2DN33_9BACL|nr:S-layer homology domain-containing protein [Paenibacillus tritici]NQX46017.1 S-layer homology domain-containing protein [Paenibacillus tritici]